MNKIVIREPRWRDNSLLIADYKIGWKNEIIIQAEHTDGSLYYPEPIVCWGETLRKYPLEMIPAKSGRMIRMRVVNLDKLLENAPWLAPRETGTAPTTKIQNLPGVSVRPNPKQMSLLPSERL